MTNADAAEARVVDASEAPKEKEEDEDPLVEGVEEREEIRGFNAHRKIGRRIIVLYMVGKWRRKVRIK